MAFVIAKKSNKNGETRNLYYIVQSYRNDGKAKRRTIVSLGEGENCSEALKKINEAKKDIQKLIDKDKLYIENPNPMFGNYWSSIKATLKFIEKDEAKIRRLEEWEKDIKKAKHTYNL